jgi:type IV secretory pathway VirJ component
VISTLVFRNARQGGHRFDGDYRTIAGLIPSRLKVPAR